jgi:hypothetical protein
MITVVVSLVFGLLLVGAIYLAVLIVLGQALMWLWNGLWIIAPLFIAYTLAFLTSFLCALVLFSLAPTSILGLTREFCMVFVLN